MMAYSIWTKWDDGSGELQIVTDDFETIAVRVTDCAEQHDGYDFEIHVSSWTNEHETEYVYNCAERSYYANQQTTNFDIDNLLERLSDRLAKRAELREAQEKIDLLQRQLAQAQRRLNELQGTAYDGKSAVIVTEEL